MTDAYKKLYEAQKDEHEKTHERLRKTEKELANVRGLLYDEQTRNRSLVDQIRKFSSAILGEIERYDDRA